MRIQTSLQALGLALVAGALPAASHSAAAADGPPVRGGCYWASNGYDVLACQMPPQVCPNGLFTGVETCAAARSHAGCPGKRQSSGFWADHPTGQEMVMIDCGRAGATYSVMACRCTGNIFGWCAGPCEPAGGIAQANVACPGTVRRVYDCDMLGSEL